MSQSVACCNSHALIAVAKRQLGSFLANPLGYVFIFAFVVTFAGATFGPADFFARNIADFGPLVYTWMPFGLAVLIAALSMGAWSAEREHGTEELLLTLPVTLADAVIGKYLAVAGFWTIALICNLTNVVGLYFIGEPDGGQIFANFVGWWLMGLSFIALGLLGSVLVSSAAIAFVFGLLFNLLAVLLFWWLEAIEPFNRGLVSLDGLLLFSGVTVFGIAAALFYLSSRRWQVGQESTIAAQVAAVLLSVLIAVNLARISDQQHWNADMSVDGVSSLGNESKELLADIPYPVTVNVFISEDEVVPDNLEGKVREVLNKAQALERLAGDKVEVRIYRPDSAYDEAGTLATEQFGLQPREMMARTVAGSEQVDVFLGAVVTCADAKQTIAFFDAGLSVEYELVRNIRTASRKAVVRPPITVTVYHSPDVPELLPEQFAELQEWIDRTEGDEQSNVTIAGVEAVAEDAEQKEGLRAHMIEVTVAAPAADAADGTEAEEAADAAEDEADGSTETKTEYRELLFGAVIEGPLGTVRVPTLGEAEVGSAMRDAVRRARRPVPVVGVLASGLELTGSFDPQSFQSRPAWAIVEEWRKHYEVREVAAEELDPETDDDIDVLLAPLPSSLTPENLERLHHYIWAGRPTVLLVDSYPLFGWQESGKMLFPAAEPMPERPTMPGQPPPQPEPKAGIEGMRPFLEALGVRMNLDQVVWSNYNPSVRYQNLPPEFLWVSKEKGGIVEDHPITEGLGLVMMPMAGVFNSIGDTKLTVEPLMRLSPEHAAGEMPIEQNYVSHFGPFAQPQWPPRRMEGVTGAEQLLAAHISGPMAHAYGTENVEQDTESRKPVNVVLIGDSDCAHSQFFTIYKNFSTGRDSQLEDPVLTKLRNVQFLENAIDYAIGDMAMVGLRGKWPRQRSLVAIDEQRAITRETKAEAVNSAQADAQQQIEDAKREMRSTLDDIRNDESLDPTEKQARLQLLEERINRELNRKITEIEEQAEGLVERAEIKQRNHISSFIFQVRLWVIGMPVLLVGMLVLIVAVIRFMRERAQVPAARERRA